jgi:hypothetical protein
MVCIVEALSYSLDAVAGYGFAGELTFDAHLNIAAF